MAGNIKNRETDAPKVPRVLQLKAVPIGDAQEAVDQITSTLRTQRTRLFERIEVVMVAILEGATYTQIILKIQNEWDIKHRQASKYIALAEKEIIKHAEKHKKKRMSFHVKARLNLYRRMMVDKDLRGAGAVLSDLATIEGLKNYNPIEDADNYKERKARAIKLLERINPSALKPIEGKSEFEIE